MCCGSLNKASAALVDGGGGVGVKGGVSTSASEAQTSTHRVTKTDSQFTRNESSNNNNNKHAIDKWNDGYIVRI